MIRVSSGDFGVRMRPIFGAATSMETNHWKVRVTFAATCIDETSKLKLNQLINAINQIPLSIWPLETTLSVQINDKSSRAYYYMLGNAYDKHDWLLQFEIVITNSAWPSVALTSGYLSLGRLISLVTFQIDGAYTKSFKDPQTISSRSTIPEIKVFQTVTENTFNVILVNQNPISLSTRWDFNTKIALEVQRDNTWVKKDGGGMPILRDRLNHDIALNIFSLNLNFVY